MKIVMISFKDFASSGWRMCEAINRFSNHEVKLIKLLRYEFAYGREADMILDSSSSDSRIAQKWLDEADIIHFKGDCIPRLNWYGLKIQPHKFIVITVGGSGFRRKSEGLDSNVTRQEFPLQTYVENTLFRSSITPELNYKDFYGFYTQHCIDSKSVDYSWVEKSVPVISHSPSEKEKKGTNLLIEALENLKRRGYKFELDIISDVKNSESVLRKRNATIFFDQVNTGFYGMSALEAMQYGIPVVCYISDIAVKQSNNKINKTEIPIIGVEKSVESIEKCFERIFKSISVGSSYLKNISLQTKEWCDEFHSYDVVGKMWESIYDKLQPISCLDIEESKKYDFSFTNKKICLTNHKNTIQKCEVVEEVNEVINDKILFICQPNSSHFAEPYIKYLGDKITISNKFRDFNEFKNYNGVIWLEWANKLTSDYLQYRSKGKVIVRIHDWEISSVILKTINWDNVDLLWFINRDARKDFFNKFPELHNKPCIFLPNAIDTSKFHISKDKVYNKSIVALSVSYKQRKEYPRLIQLFSKLLKIDSNWHLYIKAAVLDDENIQEHKKCTELIKLLNLEKSVTLITNSFNLNEISTKDDVNSLFLDKDIIISTSSHEGFQYTIAEGVCCGLYPIVYNWEWGRAKDFWGNFVEEDFDSIIKSIISWGKRGKT